MARKFRDVLHGVDDSSATYVLVPASIMKTFAGRIRVPVRMTINGVEHRTTICDMGLGPALGVPGPVRKAAGIERGDRITVSVEEDRDERTVAVPADLRRAMAAAELKTFDGLAFSHRKEYVLWVEDAKKPETRARRIAQVCEKLRERRMGGSR
jgi:bifunctional DNA-binding transcriptional regulator/antitoxin component of YhaV-PrlF toxin-antitoxin module